MKNLFIVLLTVITFAACKKDATTTFPNPAIGQYYIKLKANGQQIEHDGDLLTLQTTGIKATRTRTTLFGSTYPEMFIYAQTNDQNNNVSIRVIADTLRPGVDYILNGDSNTLYIVKKGEVFRTLDFPAGNTKCIATLHINENSSGWISGTFSGKVTNVDAWSLPSNELSITEGSFATKVEY